MRALYANKTTTNKTTKIRVIRESVCIRRRGYPTQADFLLAMEMPTNKSMTFAKFGNESDCEGDLQFARKIYVRFAAQKKMTCPRLPAKF